MFSEIDIEKVKFKLKDCSKDYNENFNQIEEYIKGQVDEILELKDLDKKKKTLEELIEATRIELTQAIDNLGTDLNIRITELEDAVENKLDNLDEKKVDRKLLGDLLIKLGNKISE